MAARIATASIFFQLDVEFILPLPIRNRFTDMSIILTCMNGVTCSASATAIWSINMYIMQIKLPISELSQSQPIFG